MNINSCRIATDEDIRTHSRGKGYNGPAFHRMNPKPERKQPGQELGRYPPNVILVNIETVRTWGVGHVDVQDKPIMRFFKTL